MTAPRFHASSAALALLLVMAGWAPAHAQRQGEDYDDADPWTGVGPEKRGPDSAAVAGFVRALAVSDPVLCQFAVASMGNHRGHWDDDDLTGTLKDEETQEARRETLSRPVADPAAIALPRVREAAALGLASAEDFGAFHDLARAVKPLGQLLGSDTPEIRAAAAADLGEIEDIRATDRLAPLVRDRDTRVRLAAVHALGEIEDHRATGALIAALRDKDGGVRRAAAEALGDVEDSKAAGPLSQALDDEDIVVRRLAAESLGELDNLERAPARLVATVGDPDAELRDGAG